jgi:hypothetical protein
LNNGFLSDAVNAMASNINAKASHIAIGTS